MTVITVTNGMLFQDFQYFSTLVSTILWRIVKKYDLFHFPATVDGCFETYAFPFQDLLMMGIGFFFIEPSPGSTYCVTVFVYKAVVMKNGNGIQSVFLKETIRLLCGRPPVIMVSLQDDLLSREIFSLFLL